VRARVCEVFCDPLNCAWRCLVKCVVREAYYCFVDMWNGYEFIRYLHHLKFRPPKAKKIDKNKPPHKIKLLERKLERNPTSERRTDNNSTAQPTLVHVALDEASEIADHVLNAWLPSAAEAEQIRRKHPIPNNDALQIEPPL